MDFLVLVAALCLLGMILCGAVVVLESFELSKMQITVGTIISVLISIPSMGLLLHYLEIWLGGYYGFEAPLTFFIFMFGPPLLVGQSIRLVTKGGKT